MYTQHMTLGDLLFGSLTTDKAEVRFYIENERSCFNNSGVKFLCYISKGCNRVYDTKGREWSKKTLKSLGMTDSHLRRHLALRIEVDNEFLITKVDPKTGYGSVLAGTVSDSASASTHTTAAMYAVHKQENEDIMKNKQDIIEALNGNISEATQDVYEEKTYKVDLLALLKDNPIIKNRGFGDTSLLRGFRITDSEMILEVNEGKVDLPAESE